MIARRFSVIALGFAAFTATATAHAVTEKHVEGVITAIEPTSITIQGKHTVTGRMDPKTRILLNGRHASATDLKVTYNARAEINLDEAWIDIEASN